jgi:hypothetical protein
MSRIGKIARLSQSVREQLNRRIEDGEPGRQLVKWPGSFDIPSTRPNNILDEITARPAADPAKSD